MSIFELINVDRTIMTSNLETQKNNSNDQTLDVKLATEKEG